MIYKDKSDVKEFLTILSTVMDEEQNAERIPGYNELYTMVNHDLFSLLSTSCYPNAPYLINKLNEALDQIEFLGLAKELVGKNAFIISSDGSRKGMELLRRNIDLTLPEELTGSDTAIPVMLYHSYTDEEAVTAVNYADIRITLSAREFHILVTGSAKYGIDLNKIIRFFLIGTKLPQKGNCYFLVGYDYSVITSKLGTISKMFSCTKSGIREIIDYGANTRMSNSITDEQTLVNALLSNNSPLYYSFSDRFETVLSEINTFYYKEIGRSQMITKTITADIAMNSENSDILSELRKNEKNKLDRLQTENKSLLECENNISQECSRIDLLVNGDEHQDNNDSNSQINNMLISFFNYAQAGMSKKASDIASMLGKTERISQEYLTNYLNSVSKGKSKGASNIVLSDLMIDNPFLWATAKVKLELEKPNLSYISDELRNAVEIMELTGHTLSSGKELLFKAMTLEDGEPKYALLEKSYSVGCSYAATLIYIIAGNCSESQKKKMLDFLAAGGYTTACLELAKMYENDSCQNILTSRRMGYLKVAASLHDVSAIEQIEESIYSQYYDGKKFLKITPAAHVKYKYILSDVCEYLIGVRNKPMKYKEHLGVIQFVSNDYSNAFTNLRGCNSDASHYCKGYMYENGLGTAKSRLDALNEYEKCSFNNAKAALAKLRDAIFEEQKQMEAEEEEGITDYDSNQNYRPVSTKTSSVQKGGCFITTAACRALHAADNCEELEILRRFRDEHICDSNSGQELVYEYYRIGPLIVEKIDSQPDSQAIYDHLWNQYIYPSYSEILKRDWKTAKLIYITMVKELCEQFGIKVDEEIAKKYSIGAPCHIQKR